MQRSAWYVETWRYTGAIIFKYLNLFLCDNIQVPIIKGVAVMLKRSTKLLMHRGFVLKKINLNMGNVLIVPTSIINIIRCYYS